MRKYTVTYMPTMTECDIEIDETPETADHIKSMVEFWIGWEDRLDANEGNYTTTFLQQLAREINYIQISENYNLLGVIGEFENREGWSTMDGAYGITILRIDDISFDHREYRVEYEDGVFNPEEE